MDPAEIPAHGEDCSVASSGSATTRCRFRPSALATWADEDRTVSPGSAEAATLRPSWLRHPRTCPGLAHLALPPRSGTLDPEDGGGEGSRWASRRPPGEGVPTAAPGRGNPGAVEVAFVVADRVGGTNASGVPQDRRSASTHADELWVLRSVPSCIHPGQRTVQPGLAHVGKLVGPIPAAPVACVAAAT